MYVKSSILDNFECEINGSNPSPTTIFTLKNYVFPFNKNYFVCKNVCKFVCKGLPCNDNISLYFMP